MPEKNLLLGPEARRRILCATYVAPAHELYLRELVRRTGLAVRTVQQEVDRLVTADLLVQRRDGNRRYFKANAAHPLFHAVREIILKTDGLAGVLRDALGTRGIAFATVFGSIAAGTATGESDIDLLVVGAIGLRDAVKRLASARDTLGREVNPVVWTRAEFQRRVRERDPFLSRVLAGPLIPVIGDVPAAP